MFKGRIALTVLVAVAATMSVSPAAHAESFAMSSQLRNFCCTDWVGRTQTPTPVPNPGGNPFLFMGGAVEQGALVSRTVDQDLSGGAPFDVSIPASRIGTHFLTAGFLHPHPLFDTMTLGIDLENKPGQFFAGGGPGSFEYCPDSYGPAPGACPSVYYPWTGSVSTGPPYKGRFDITAGPNQFGGTMGWLGPGVEAVIHVRNAPGSSASRFTVRNFGQPFSMVGESVGQSQTAPTPAGILAFGPLDSVDTAYSTSMYQTNPTAVALSTIMGSGRATGHVWTTGMVQISVITNDIIPFRAVTITGSDNRETTGPNRGQGNLTLVSASVTHDFRVGISQIRGNVLRLTLPEPSLGLSVVAGALGIILIGFGCGGRRAG